MSIKQEFKYISEDALPFVTIDQWVETLPENEQKIFANAKVRQLKMRQQAVDLGQLKVESNGTYVWDEQHVTNKTADKYKPWDPVWLTFWNRYLEVNKIKFEITETKI